MYRKGQVQYRALPLPDRVQKTDHRALEDAEAFRGYMIKRHSVRQSSDRPVPEAIITACIDVAKRKKPRDRVMAVFR